VKGLMLGKLLIKHVINNYANREKIKGRKLRKKREKKSDRTAMIKVFGKLRYYLSFLFGPVALYTFNHRPCEDGKKAAPVQQPSNVIPFPSVKAR
jgi:hypothetical protein